MRKRAGVKRAANFNPIEACVLCLYRVGLRLAKIKKLTRFSGNRKPDRRDRTEYRKRYYAANSEQQKARSLKWYASNKERAKAYRKARADVLKSWYRDYNRKNRSKLNEKSKRWQKANRARVNATFRKSYQKSEQIRLAKRLRARIRSALKRQSAKKCARTVELLGCSIAEARWIIESRMIPPMTWQDFLSGEVVIDHNKPINAFDLTDPVQQRACFSIDNLYPLWKSDNLRKSDKYEPQENADKRDKITHPQQSLLLVK